MTEQLETQVNESEVSAGQADQQPETENTASEQQAEESSETASEAAEKTEA